MENPVRVEIIGGTTAEIAARIAVAFSELWAGREGFAMSPDAIKGLGKTITSGMEAAFKAGEGRAALRIADTIRDGAQDWPQATAVLLGLSGAIREEYGFPDPDDCPCPKCKADEAAAEVAEALQSKKPAEIN